MEEESTRTITEKSLHQTDSLTKQITTERGKTAPKRRRHTRSKSVDSKPEQRNVENVKQRDGRSSSSLDDAVGTKIAKITLQRMNVEKAGVGSLKDGASSSSSDESAQVSSDKRVVTRPSRLVRQSKSHSGDEDMSSSSIVNSSTFSQSLEDDSRIPVVKRKRAQSVSVSRTVAFSSSTTCDQDAGTPTKRRRGGRSDVSQVISEESDTFCWMCHKDGAVLVPCETCPRVYHQKCVALDSVPISGWACPECVTILHAENMDTRSRAMRLLSLDQLCSLLKFAIGKLKDISGSEPFWRPVDLVEFSQYRDYVVHPMDLSQLENNIRKRMYGSTEAFLADTRWILHNCIIFNTVQAKLSQVAKKIVSMCKHEMTEIETCPDCYLNAHTKKDTWFIEVCRKPHLLVWAKLKGFPFWPAKIMRINKDQQADARFFGAHDRAWVPIKECYLYSRMNPNTTKNKKHKLEECLEELGEHVKKLQEKFGSFVPAPPRIPFEPDREQEQLRMLLPNYRGEETLPRRREHLSYCNRISQERSSRMTDYFLKDSKQQHKKIVQTSPNADIHNSLPATQATADTLKETDSVDTEESKSEEASQSKTSSEKVADSVSGEHKKAYKRKFSEESLPTDEEAVRLSEATGHVNSEVLKQKTYKTLRRAVSEGCMPKVRKVDYGCGIRKVTSQTAQSDESASSKNEMEWTENVDKTVMMDVDRIRCPQWLLSGKANLNIVDTLQEKLSHSEMEQAAEDVAEEKTDVEDSRLDESTPLVGVPESEISELNKGIVDKTDEKMTDDYGDSLHEAQNTKAATDSDFSVSESRQSSQADDGKINQNDEDKHSIKSSGSDESDIIKMAVLPRLTESCVLSCDASVEHISPLDDNTAIFADEELNETVNQSGIVAQSGLISHIDAAGADSTTEKLVLGYSDLVKYVDTHSNSSEAATDGKLREKDISCAKGVTEIKLHESDKNLAVNPSNNNKDSSPPDKNMCQNEEKYEDSCCATSLSNESEEVVPKNLTPEHGYSKQCMEETAADVFEDEQNTTVTNNTEGSESELISAQNDTSNLTGGSIETFTHTNGAGDLDTVSPEVERVEQPELGEVSEVEESPSPKDENYLKDDVPGELVEGSEILPQEDVTCKDVQNDTRHIAEDSCEEQEVKCTESSASESDLTSESEADSSSCDSSYNRQTVPNPVVVSEQEKNAEEFSVEKCVSNQSKVVNDENCNLQLFSVDQECLKTEVSQASDVVEHIHEMSEREGNLDESLIPRKVIPPSLEAECVVQEKQVSKSMPCASELVTEKNTSVSEDGELSESLNEQDDYEQCPNTLIEMFSSASEESENEHCLNPEPCETEGTPREKDKCESSTPTPKDVDDGDLGEHVCQDPQVIKLGVPLGAVTLTKTASNSSFQEKPAGKKIGEVLTTVQRKSHTIDSICMSISKYKQEMLSNNNPLCKPPLDEVALSLKQTKHTVKASILEKSLADTKQLAENESRQNQMVVEEGEHGLDKISEIPAMKEQLMDSKDPPHSPVRTKSIKVKDFALHGTSTFSLTSRRDSNGGNPNDSSKNISETEDIYPAMLLSPNVTITVMKNKEVITEPSRQLASKTGSSKNRTSINLSNDISLSLVQSEQSAPSKESVFSIKDLMKESAPRSVSPSLDMECVHESDHEDSLTTQPDKEKIAISSLSSFPVSIPTSLYNILDGNSGKSRRSTEEAGGRAKARKSLPSGEGIAKFSHMNGVGASISVPADKSNQSQRNSQSLNSPSLESRRNSYSRSLSEHGNGPGSMEDLSTSNFGSVLGPVPGTSAPPAGIGRGVSSRGRRKRATPVQNVPLRVPQSLPQLESRPGVGPPFFGNIPPSLPSEAGPVSAELNKHASKLTDYMRLAMEEWLRTLANEGNQQAIIQSLSLELERARWNHQQELAELKHNSDTTMMEMWTSIENSHKQEMADARRMWEVSMQKAINEVKRKQWCTWCLKEAMYYCCWNNSYCCNSCQELHWPTHMGVCTQEEERARAAANPSSGLIPAPTSAGRNSRQKAGSRGQPMSNGNAILQVPMHRPPVPTMSMHGSNMLQSPSQSLPPLSRGPHPYRMRSVPQPPVSMSGHPLLPNYPMFSHDQRTFNLQQHQQRMMSPQLQPQLQQRPTSHMGYGVRPSPHFFL